MDKMHPTVLLAHLRARRPSVLPEGELTVQPIQESAFRVSVGGQSFFVKWIAASNARGQNELRIGRSFARLKAIPAPRLLFEVPLADGVIAGWEWAAGADLRAQHRHRLPEAFACLGRLHKALRSHSEVMAPLGSARYPTLRAMLAAETYRLTAPLELPVQARCLAILARLEAGYPTLIHGDMHPGNILVEGERVWIVDWAYACNSLNLFDLDYIQTLFLPAPGPDWSVIGPEEAGPVLEAYYQAAGLEGVDIYRTHQAVMVWNLLRAHENALLNGYRAAAQQTRRQLYTLLGQVAHG